MNGLLRFLFVFFENSENANYERNFYNCISSETGGDHISWRACSRKRPFIASLDHSVCKRIREIEQFNMGHLLGLGPEWISKEEVRKIVLATKAKTQRSSTNDPSNLARRIRKVCTFSHRERADESAHVSINTSRDPTEGSLPSLTPNNGSTSRIVQEQPQTTPETHSLLNEDFKRNNDEIVRKYCQWFDRLASSILENEKF